MGAAGLWLFTSSAGRSAVHTTSASVEAAAQSASEAVQLKLQALDLRPQDIKEDLANSGTVARRKARDVGAALADATADARTTAAIKGKMLASRDLSSLSIAVNTTEGVVTLSGRVASTEEISKAMLLALETEGVREVISTLQVKSRAGDAPAPFNVRTQAANVRK